MLFAEVHVAAVPWLAAFATVFDAAVEFAFGALAVAGVVVASFVFATLAGGAFVVAVAFAVGAASAAGVASVADARANLIARWPRAHQAQNRQLELKRGPLVL